MTKQQKKRQNIRKNLKKVKEAQITPWRILLSIIVFLGVLLTLPAILKGSSSIWDFLAWFYLAVACAAAVIDVIQGAVPLRFKNIAKAFLGYIYRLFMELVLIALCLPVLALMFILGPCMFLVFFVSLGCLMVYFIEIILKIDIKGITARDSGLEAIIELGALLVSGYIIFSLDKTEKLFDYLLGKIVDGLLFVESLGRERSKKENQETTRT